MKLRFLLPGVALIVVGALPLVAPGLATQIGTTAGIMTSPTQTSTYFAHVNPGNYSFVEYHLAAGFEVTASIASGQQPVDFFLMNGGNFTAWRQSMGQPSQVFPQSSLDVKNRTFAISGSTSTRDFFMVFVSRSTSSPTDVLIRLSLQNTATDPVLTTVPAVFAGVGLIMAVYGVRSSKKGGRQEPRAAAPAPAGSVGGWQGLLGTLSPKCKYCGSTLANGSSFCPSCNKSQG